jgi:hypothetical protein
VIHYWYQALSTPFGIELVCSDPEGTRRALYGARKSAQDADLAQISICASPFDPHKLWLVKKGAQGALGGPNDS